MTFFGLQKGQDLKNKEHTPIRSTTPVLCEERLLPLPELSRKIEGPVSEGYSSRERTVEAKLYPFQPPASSYHTL